MTIFISYCFTIEVSENHRMVQQAVWFVVTHWYNIPVGKKKKKKKKKNSESMEEKFTIKNQLKWPYDLFYHRSVRKFLESGVLVMGRSGYMKWQYFSVQPNCACKYVRTTGTRGIDPLCQFISPSVNLFVHVYSQVVYSPWGESLFLCISCDW